jgi:hypothetical protein
MKINEYSTKGKILIIMFQLLFLVYIQLNLPFRVITIKTPLNNHYLIH